MATFNEFIDSIIADGNDGKAFELFCKHFLETSPEYSEQFDKVWLWDDWPNNWGLDKGIDLVAKYKGRDKFCAIQAKCYSAHNTVQYSEVTNFLADSNRPLIEDRILMMSTDRLSDKTSRETIEGQEKPVVIRDRNYFTNLPYDYPKHISELKKPQERVKKAEPRKHQDIAIKDVVKGFKKNDRGQLIMACGTGKTFTTLWIKEELKSKTTLVLLPSLSLLSQTMREWVWGANHKFEALAVCSDPTVGRSKEESENDISAMEVGKVTWQIEDITAFLKVDEPKIIFCTYQSSKLIMEAQRDKDTHSFDLVICDEAHRCAGSGVEGAAFSTVLNEELIRAKKRLFTTATPRYFGASSKGAAERRGVEIYSMDDQNIFGPIFHRLSFGEAIEIDMLTDYQVVVVGVDEPTVYQWIFDREIMTTGEKQKLDAKSLASKVAVLKAIKDYDLQRIISFHNSVNKAKYFSTEVDRISEFIDPKQRPEGKIWSRHVDGTMLAGKRRQIINGLKELDGYDIGLLTNARCLSEGVDVPSLDGVAFVEPRSSQVDIIQSVGRAIRKSDNKTKGTIVLPVFLEEGDDPDTIISDTNFKPIWEVLKALKAHDEKLNKELDEFRTKLGSEKGRVSDRINKVIFDLPINLPSDFASKLTTKIVEAVTTSWWFWFGLLQDYCEERKSALVPTDHKTSSGYRLGGWVDTQRQSFRNNKLTKEQVALLEGLPSWYWSKNDADWDNGYAHLLELVTLKGHSKTKDNELSPDGFKIGRWVRNRRTDYLKGMLSSEKIELLEAQPEWVWNALEAEWDRNFQLLVEYVDKNGNCLVPTKHKTADGSKLGAWVGTQRQNKEKVRKQADRWDRLTGLNGWAWNKPEAAWNASYNLLKNYYDINKSMPPLSYKTADGYTLGNWLATQRKTYKTLTRLQQRKLKDINFLKRLKPDRTEAWENNYNLLFEFYKEHKHSRVHVDFIINDVKLGGWVVSQRSRRNQLSEYQIKQLEKLEFDWDPRMNEWEDAFAEFKKFVAREGHADVPANWTTNHIKLGKWVRVQRQGRRPPTEERKKRLNNLGFIWDIQTYEWNSAFSKLEKFHKEFGHSKPKDKQEVDGFNIGGWCYRQRKNQHKLEDWQTKKLNEMGFVWGSLRDK